MRQFAATRATTKFTRKSWADQLAQMATSYNVKGDGHISGHGKTVHPDFIMAAGEMTEAEFTAFLADCHLEIAGVRRSVGLTPHYIFELTCFSPRNYFSIARKISSEILRRIERKPHSTCRALRNLALGILATHVGLDPARADRVDRHRAP